MPAPNLRPCTSWRGSTLLDLATAVLSAPSFKGVSAMAEETFLEKLANRFFPQEEYPTVLPLLKTRVSMSPSSGDVAQTPEPKSTGGLASVFKSLTGNKSSRSPPNAQSPASIAQQLNGIGGLQNTIYGGPPDYEQLLEQLKIGNPLAERLAAAEAIRHAVHDYPLSGVTNIFKEAKDLIEPTKPPEARVAGFELFTACVRNATPTDPERLAYFQILTAPANTEDFYLQLTSLVELADHGKRLQGFHYSILPLLTAWLQQCFRITAAARSKAGRQGRSKGKSQLDEEVTLSLLFAFIADVMKYTATVLTEESAGGVLDIVLSICLQTPLSSDLRACINVIDAVITYGEIPSGKLMGCVKVLCSIHCLVGDVEPEAWRSISNLAKSHHGQTTVRILLDILRDPSAGEKGKQNVREIRGALSVLKRLFAKNGEDGFPLVPFTLLVHAMKKVISVEHAKVDADILHLILSLFGDEEVKDNVMEEDWLLMFDVVIKCSQRALETPDGRPITSRSRMASPLIKDEPVEQNLATGLAQTLYSLIIRIEKLVVGFAGEDFLQREDCVKFFVHVHAHLPESCAKLVIDHFMEYRYCYPSDLEWKENVKTILTAFFMDRSQPTHIRLHALRAVTDVFKVVEMMDEHEEPEIVRTFVAAILEDTGDEKDIAVLQEIVAFSVAVTQNADEPLFDYVISAIRASVTSDRLQSPLGSPTASRQGILNHKSSSSAIPSHLTQTPSNVVTKGLVQIFMRSMGSSAYKSLRVFDELLQIAKSHDCETDARISALKMLSRLRADWAYRIFLTLSTESDGLAASLFRTTGSLARKQAADELTQQHRSSRNDDSGSSRISRSTSFGQGHPQARQPLRSISGVSRTTQRHHHMWMYPDVEALPEATSGTASSFLRSFMEREDKVEADIEKPGADKEDSSKTEKEPLTKDCHGVSRELMMLPHRIRKSLNIGTYLDTVTGLVQNGCDWEVYSYILVHLPSQLTNQALFRGAIPQIRKLREALCDLLNRNSFQEPPVSSGLRKADVAICLFQTLNMVMSYNQHFTKTDQDEIVRTFLQGIGSTWERTAKCCIHALSICSHEMPGSTSKALVTILQKMSTIITQSHVAIHILEFLACLARMPDLYVNFREEEYRTVFAICFRYLQYVRDQPVKESFNRSSYPHARSSIALTESSISESNFQPNSSDDLPQYVYALAYHVIIFWFLSLKLNDRASQVSWIAKNLVSTDANGKENIDEQAQVTLDFMQRVAYADVDESAADPTFTSARFGEILKKRWIIGQSLVTVEQATRGGWAQITKRQPSGTSCYIIREKFSRPPPHQSQISTDTTRDARHSDANMVLPSHLLLQLSASIPQIGEPGRPIPLPNDEFMERAVKAFDRNFTVDGHKVGVIYIGENQTQEVEILANILGSSDYTDFLSGLGTLTKLQGANFNTQGLDRVNNSDGEYAFCWRDRVTEIVFHVTTQMPTNLENDPQCIGKKRHIGNDFVNIIFNNSGHPFRFDTFPSEFNYVNIVITPESRASFVATRLRSTANAKSAFYKVQVMSKPGFPEISPAAETKIMSLAALPGFIRLLALNASVFSLVWANREGGEHVSSWRNRLREINRLRERYKPKSSTTTSPPGTSNGVSHESRNVRDSINSLRRSSVANFLTNASEPNSQRSSILSTAETEVGPGVTEEGIVDSLDFSRWA
ncbi:hypothetical protein G7Y89_g9364 [Cudoniella acicularis]|uniref:Rap-GAP domain-containing protein n=1 Tax=Cudoniella acicularis TaxID=354080 RepID=A0A8H4RHG3_9HELO|nr:hypothetical protein G7Y89_g9364 [Cudoniella acicularis]